MKKILFRYGSMNAAKSLNLLSTNHNYKELGLSTVVVVPDSITSKSVKSRAGLEADAIHFSELKDHIKSNKVDCILIDESQFLSKEDVEYLNHISLLGITVICYGLRTTFKGELFEGARWLFALADEIEEIPTLCSCGRKARMNIRLVDGEVDKSEEVVKLREEQEVVYVSLCRDCYYKYYNGIEDANKILKFDNTVNCK